MTVKGSPDGFPMYWSRRLMIGSLRRSNPSRMKPVAVPPLLSGPIHRSDHVRRSVRLLKKRGGIKVNNNSSRAADLHDGRLLVSFRNPPFPQVQDLLSGARSESIDISPGGTSILNSKMSARKRPAMCSAPVTARPMTRMIRSAGDKCDGEQAAEIIEWLGIGAEWELQEHVCAKCDHADDQHREQEPKTATPGSCSRKLKEAIQAMRQKAVQQRCKPAGLDLQP